VFVCYCVDIIMFVSSTVGSSPCLCRRGDDKSFFFNSCGETLGAAATSGQL
jgi:hypothetical protein